LFIALSGCAAMPEPELASASASEGVDRSWSRWAPGSIDFAGPQASENDPVNPFTDYRLTVTFSKGSKTAKVRGFFAADGNAAESSAQSGNIWRVRFAPDEAGDWDYRAQLVRGSDAALHGQVRPSDSIVGQWNGQFKVAPADPADHEFHRSGVLRSKGHLLRWSGTGEYFLKGGANSPENLLGYADFDGTYRIAPDARDGESAVGEQLHKFAPHLRDWRKGDPTWKNGKGKGLIGAINYLADSGMNSVYFLTMNVGGDGKDVWPWLSPDDPTRFDVSKLAQWEIVFDHMQRRGIALHIVLQETENELLLDGGETKRLRQLYFRELIARFAHHPALFWNLGEENGPVHWRPEGQNDAQRIAMAQFIAANDPYRHPILLHTHAETTDKDRILTPLLGLEALQGLSFQVSDRTKVNFETRKWNALSRKAERPWAITMDEIGMWQIGARNDRDDPTHDSLRRHALWGHLLGGGAGVEWYFGAHQDGNDLTTEDWRTRGELWRQTALAKQFFSKELPYWDVQPCESEAYCLAKPGDLYAVYLSTDTPGLSRADIAAGDYSLHSFDPVTGQMRAPKIITIRPDVPLSRALQASDADQVVLLRRMNKK
jgi:hypothetical protein